MLSLIWDFLRLRIPIFPNQIYKLEKYIDIWEIMLPESWKKYFAKIAQMSDLILRKIQTE